METFTSVALEQSSDETAFLRLTASSRQCRHPETGSGWALGRDRCTGPDWVLVLVGMALPTPIHSDLIVELLA